MTDLIDTVNEKLACTGCYFEPITDWHIERLAQYVKTPVPIDPLETIHFNMDRGPSGALYYNGKLLCIMGIAIHWKGMGEVLRRFSMLVSCLPRPTMASTSLYGSRNSVASSMTSSR